MNKRISDTIEEYRNKVIEGKIVNLVPFTPADSEKVVEIRNRERNKYNLNQKIDLNVEGQNKWYESYLNTKDDILWCIYNKEGTFIGTIRIHGVDENEDLCIQGSFMIDEDQAGGAPYALEAEILSLDFAFYQLKIKNVVNEDRPDNKAMNNLTKKLGFEYKKKIIIRDVEYNYYILTPEAYAEEREKFVAVINYFGEER